ncbi:MAG: class I tRNA ligase family protein, partial [bacterium]
IAEHKGSEMIGMEYEPLYPYLLNTISGEQKEKLPNAFKVVSADFVTTTDGTGIVHIAPMYGAEDFDVATKNNLPKFHTVDDTGHFIAGTDFLETRFAKDEQVAIDIIKDLAGRGLLFKKEKYEHSYPHCWRCKTPLLYYARDSWYIAMSKLHDELVKENEDINWEPAHIREGRFGEWLDNIKDWAISRERYWGTPLPIWQSADGERLFVNSFETLKKYTKKSGNKYFVMRHGEAEHNLHWQVSTHPDNPHHLTDNGKEQVRVSAEDLKDKKIDMMVISPFVRTRETAQIVKEVLGLSDEQTIFDERLKEFGVYSFEGKTWGEYHDAFPKTKEYVDAKNDGDESYLDIKLRVMELLYEYETTYKDKNILFVTHGGPAWMLRSGGAGLSIDETYALIAQENNAHFDDMKNAEVRAIDFVPVPHNENYELDPHRPFIDEVILEKDGKEFHRIKEVMDVWFDSGAMPFAQDHYPFEHKKDIDGGIFTKSHSYPADFISEAIDQTRGWFYTLHAIGVLMGKGKAYKNVICLGHLLDAEGKKMSKSIGNIVNPWEAMDKFGVDTLRLWMYSVNQPGDSKNFDEKTVKELEGKVFTLTYNILSFYELYRDVSLEPSAQSLVPTNVLDQWILARFNFLVEKATEGLDNYKTFEPVREIRDFVGDLSTWYLRRSRDRLKDGDKEAKQTLYYVLKNFAKILAPFAPFSAEDLWLKLRTENDQISVHLTSWPEIQKVDTAVLEEMQKVRDICTQGNALRKSTGIPVRQPLNQLKVESQKLKDEYTQIICDELNIKGVEYGNSEGFVLDTEITPELKREGNYRELVRALQDLRKETGLTPEDTINLTISENAKTLVEEFEADLKKTVQIREVIFADGSNEIKIDTEVYKVSIEK